MSGAPAGLRGLAPALLLLSACTAAGAEDDSARSGSSLPPSASAAPPGAVTGAVFLGPGAGGLEQAEAMARQICGTHGRTATLSGARVSDGATRLRYRCD